MKKLFLTILCFLMMIGSAHAVTLCFEWDANTEPDLAGYRIFARTGPSYDYDNPIWQSTGLETTCCIPNFDYLTTYYFVARAFDTEGLESGDSNEISWYEDPYTGTPPSNPSNLRITAP